MSENENITALALVPRGFEEAEKYAEKLSKSTLLPEHFRGKPADIFWALMKGAELGVTPTQALENIYTVKGKPGLYADFMVALVLRSGLAEYFRVVEATEETATCETKRRGDPEPKSKTVTIEKAKKAGWYEQNAKYKTEPEVMLAARAKARLAREVYPDVLRGMASIEELRDEPDGPTFSAPPPPSKGAIIDIKEAATAATGGQTPRGPEPKAQPAPPPAKSEAPPPAAEPAPAEPPKASESELRARDLAEQMKAAKTGEDLASLLIMAGDLAKKLGAKHPEIVAMRKVYSKRKAELEEAA